MRYLSHTPDDVRVMLEAIKKPSIDSLFDSIPSAQRLKRPLDLPRSLTEIELKKLLQERAGKAPRLSFLGAGATMHHVPELVSQLLLRGEWLTAYTPYQPEVSQGTLQAIFEFQTIVASLFGCEVANASMYDGATALAEALLMATRLRPGTKNIVLSRAIHPEYRQVCQTILPAAGFHIVEVPIDALGQTDLQALNNRLAQLSAQDGVAAVAYQSANFLGQLEAQSQIIGAAHAHQAIAIAATTDPLVFGAIHSPGQLGADIVVGEGLGFCGHLSLGAPGVGLFATSQKHLRQMPGRLCGATLDADGNRGFVLTLSTREQHIRREKATSNICTNHGLMALAFTIATSLYGKEGFHKLAKHNLKKTMYFRQKAEAAGLKVAFKGAHFNETVLQFASESDLQHKAKRLSEKDIYAGVPLGHWYPEYKGCLLVSTTELHEDSDLDALITALS